MALPSVSRYIQNAILSGLGIPTSQTQTGTSACVLADSTQTISGTKTFSGTTNFGADGAGLMVATYLSDGTPAATDTAFFVAPRACKVVAISEVHAVAAGGASVIQVTKDTSTNAPGAGNNLLTNNTNTGFDLNGTANTVQTGTLTATAADLLLAAGDRLSVDYANTIQSTAGVCITVILQPM